MDEDYKEVYFNQYCGLCQYHGKREFEEPCNECLDNPMNVDSHKPVNWKETNERK